MLNYNQNSYNTLYYLSGYLFPIILVFYSLNNFTNYKFNNNEEIDLTNGLRYLSYIIFPILLILSTLIVKYYAYLFSIIFNESFYFLKFTNLQFIFIIIFSLLLLIKTTKKIIKYLYLIYYFINYSIYWTINSYPLYITDNFNDKYLNHLISNNVDFNYINIIYLFLLEVLFFIWSYVSHKNNISDWHIPIPLRSDLVPLINIFLFYFGLTVYFVIFNNILLQS